MTSFALRALFLTAGAAAVGMIGAPLALADEQQTTLGSAADVVNGDNVQQWTVGELEPSSDVIPFQPVGTLWEAEATARAAQGGIPVIPGFSARAGDASYPVLWQVPTAEGVNPSALPPGGATPEGKLYFDVTGAAPTGVAFSNGGRDLAVWTAPPPAAEGTGYGAPAVRPLPVTGAAQNAPAAVAVAPPAAAGQGTPAAGVPAATGSTQGAPAAAGSQGTPAGTPATTAPAAGAQGTPAGTPATTAPAAGAQGTPAAAGSQGAPAGTPATAAPAAGAQGTPAGAPSTAAAVPTTPAPAAAGSQGTPAQGTPATVTPTAAPTTTVVPQGSSAAAG